MMVPIIVIIALTTHIHCQATTHFDQLMYVRGDGPYVLTGVVSGRPEYKHTRLNRKILFSDNQWEITKRDGTTWYSNPRQEPTPPSDGWYHVDRTHPSSHGLFYVHDDGGLSTSITVHTVELGL